jgi:hypothetical protein
MKRFSIFTIALTCNLLFSSNYTSFPDSRPMHVVQSDNVTEDSIAQNSDLPVDDIDGTEVGYRSASITETRHLESRDTQSRFMGSIAQEDRPNYLYGPFETITPDIPSFRDHQYPASGTNSYIPDIYPEYSALTHIPLPFPSLDHGTANFNGNWNINWNRDWQSMLQYWHDFANNAHSSDYAANPNNNWQSNWNIDWNRDWHDFNSGHVNDYASNSDYQALPKPQARTKPNLRAYIHNKRNKCMSKSLLNRA